MLSRYGAWTLFAKALSRQRQSSRLGQRERSSHGNSMVAGLLFRAALASGRYQTLEPKIDRHVTVHLAIVNQVAPQRAELGLRTPEDFNGLRGRGICEGAVSAVAVIERGFQRGHNIGLRSFASCFSLLGFALHRR